MVDTLLVNHMLQHAIVVNDEVSMVDALQFNHVSQPVHQVPADPVAAPVHQVPADPVVASMVVDAGDRPPHGA